MRWLTHARLLRRLPALAEGMRAGRVSAEHLAKIADLAREIGVDKVRAYDQILATLCADAGPRQVELACERIRALEDPDGPEPDPKDVFDRREVTFSRLGSMLYLRGRLDPDGGAALQAAVDALMRPPQTFDPRTAAQRRADALVDLARGALAGQHPPSSGGERPHLGLLLTPEVLFGTTTGATPTDASTREGHGPQQRSAGHPARHGETDPLAAVGVPARPERPWLNWAGEISAECAQRLACDAIIWRLVLDPRTGLPLDVGRKHRSVPWWAEGTTDIPDHQPMSISSRTVPRRTVEAHGRPRHRRGMDHPTRRQPVRTGTIKALDHTIPSRSPPRRTRNRSAAPTLTGVARQPPTCGRAGQRGDAAVCRLGSASKVDAQCVEQK